MKGRKRRGLTAAERALWAKVAAQTRPLRAPTTPEPEAAPPAPAPLPPLAALEVPARPRIAFDGAVAQSPGQPRMDRRRYEKLRRGQIEPEARLDLHGLTAERAHAALERFIRGAHSGGKRLVLVITGKGRATDDVWSGASSDGVLRRSVPHWLGLAPLAGMVLQVSPAHRKHGGDGALYVYLRRPR